ncbi:DoxX family protein [Skermania piniformis]|uniref:DoxX family membrane protein n=1 Tax=Skermania pinensis TaxID=39122 RepID=A0ABX8S403_9ACTN|nr:DoxX family membrane protein [Skermania piniformis]QXQ12564.1 DoxX family membrane protein [Skermania piniformis]
MDVIVLIGRILFVVLFLGSGVGHLTQSQQMVPFAEARGVPLAKLAVPASGLLLLAGGLSVLLGIWADLGSLLLIAFLLPTTFLMHKFWTETDAQAKQAEMVSFNKNISLTGAALALFAFFAHTPELGLTITGPLFSL